MTSSPLCSAPRGQCSRNTPAHPDGNAICGPAFLHPVVLACAIFLAPCRTHSAGIPVLHDGAIPGLTVTRTEWYDRSSLTGYIDGGAELFREYGFQQLLVQEVRAEDSLRLSVEIYAMSDPGAAFGIYSVSRNACGPADSSFLIACSSPYQDQFVARNLYVRIQNGVGSAQAQLRSRSVARWVVAEIGQDPPSLPPLFGHPLFRSLSGDVKLIRGQLGMQNGLPDWSDLCDGTGRFSVYALHLAGEGQGSDVLALQFESVEDCDLVLTQIGALPGIGTVQRTIRGSRTFIVRRETPRTCTVVETGGVDPGTPLYDALFRSPQ